MAILLDNFPHENITSAMNATMLEACGFATAEAVAACCADIRHGKIERKFGDSFSSAFSRHLRRVNNELLTDIRLRTERLQIEPPVVQISDEERAGRVKRAGQVNALMTASLRKFDHELKVKKRGSLGNPYQNIDGMKARLAVMKASPIIPPATHAEDALDTPSEGEHEKRATNQ